MPLTAIVSPTQQELVLAQELYAEKVFTQNKLISTLSSGVRLNPNSYEHPLDSAHSIAGSDFAKRVLEDAVADYFVANLFNRADILYGYLEFMAASTLSNILGMSINTIITVKFQDDTTYDLRIKGLRSTFYQIQIEFEVVPGSGTDSNLRIPENGEYRSLQPSLRMVESGYFDKAAAAHSSGLSGYNIVNLNNGVEITVCTGTRNTANWSCEKMFIFR